MTCGRTVLLLMAVGLGLAIPGSVEAKLRFRSCGEETCARLSVPLDHSGAVAGRLSLRVERHDSYDRVERGVTLVLPGTPGYSGTQVDEDAWEARGRDVVLFDQRGTGAGALRCRDLEAAAATDAGREAAACATLLGDRRAFFRTSDTVEDIEALRVELGLDRLTIAASAYGAYVAQRYALRYPDRVERLLLESPVDAAGLDPLHVDSMAAVRRMLPALCRIGCGSFTSDALADTSRLVERMAREPLRGTIVGPTGHRRTAFLTRQELLYTLMSGDDDLLSNAEYPAAVVSALRGDSAPILRMKRRAVAHPLNLSGPASRAPLRTRRLSARRSASPGRGPRRRRSGTRLSTGARRRWTAPSPPRSIQERSCGATSCGSAAAGRPHRPLRRRTPVRCRTCRFW